MVMLRLGGRLQSPCKGRECECVNADVPGGGNRMCKGLEAWCVGLTEGRVCCERGGWGTGETEKGKPTPTGSSKPVRNLDFLSRAMGSH